MNCINSFKTTTLTPNTKISIRRYWTSLEVFIIWTL